MKGSGVARKNYRGGQCSFKNFSSGWKTYYAIRDVHRQRRLEMGIRGVNNVFCIRTSANFSSSLQPKEILFFPAEFHSKMFVFEKYHKLIGNCKQFFTKQKLLQDQDRISTFFCKRFQADRQPKKAQISWTMGTNNSAFLLMPILTRFLPKQQLSLALFHWFWCLLRNFRKEHVKMSVKTIGMFENFVKNGLNYKSWIVSYIYS